MSQARDMIERGIAEGYAREIEKACRGQSAERRTAAADELRDIAAKHPYGAALRDAADRLS